jgi:hypothetical protein
MSTSKDLTSGFTVNVHPLVSGSRYFKGMSRHGAASAGQLFNCFLALTLRTLPLIATGLVALAVFWPASLSHAVSPPPGMTVIDEPIHAWADADDALQETFCRFATLRRTL